MPFHHQLISDIRVVSLTTDHHAWLHERPLLTFAAPAMGHLNVQQVCMLPLRAVKRCMFDLQRYDEQ